MQKWYIITDKTTRGGMIDETATSAVTRLGAWRELLLAWERMSERDRKGLDGFYAGLFPVENGVLGEVKSVVTLDDFVRVYGGTYPRAIVRARMDFELRAEIAHDMFPCSEQEFVDEYSRRHEEKFGEVFRV